MRSTAKRGFFSSSAWRSAQGLGDFVDRGWNGRLIASSSRDGKRIVCPGVGHCVTHASRMNYYSSLGEPMHEDTEYRGAIIVIPANDDGAWRWSAHDKKGA